MSKIETVCVYCGSSNRVADTYKTLAHDVATALATSGHNLLYGGGRVGLMGIVAEAGLAAGAKVIGIIPKHIEAKEIQHTGLTELHVVDSMHTRKAMMVSRSDAFVILPGGFGTLDEAFEILTWRQLGLHNKPIIIYNAFGFWDPLVTLIDQLISVGFAQESNRDLYQVVSTIPELMRALQKDPGPEFDPKTKWM